MKSRQPKNQIKEKRKRFISLRLLASLAAAGLVAITVVIIVWVNEMSMRQTLTQEAQTQLVLEARNLAITGSDALLSEYPELTLIPLIKDILEERDEIQDVVILNHEGKIQGSSDSRAIGQAWHRPPEFQALENTMALETGERLSESDRSIMMECPVHYAVDSDLGRVIMTLDKGFIEAKIQATRAKLLVTASILLAVAVLLTTFFMSRLFRPLTLLREGLQRIGHGDLDSPMQVRDVTELGLLSDSVNTLALDLKASRKLAKAREQEVIDTQKEVIITLGQVVESRSSETANHTIRVGDMSYQLARLAGLSEGEAELIRAASPMHDVGKIGIPDSVLNKPGKLTAEEYSVMQNHPEIGYNILNKSERPLLKAAAIIARQHHEKWNGKGYPQGLRGEAIHLYGRIVGLVDVFDAIFSNRVYRQAMPLEKALNILREERGQHFDPRLVDLFLENLPKFLAITERYQDHSTKGQSPAIQQPVAEDSTLSPA